MGCVLLIYLLTYSLVPVFKKVESFAGQALSQMSNKYTLPLVLVPSVL